MAKNTLVSDIAVNSPRKTVWAYLSDQYNLRKLCESVLDAGVEFDNTASPYRDAGRPVFQARQSGEDLLLSAEGCSVAIRVIADGAGTKVVAAVSYDDDAALHPTRKQVEQLLNRVRRDAETQAGGLDPKIPAEDRKVFHAKQEYLADEDIGKIPRKGAQNGKSTSQKNERAKGGKVVAIVAVAAVVVLLAVLVLPRIIGGRQRSPLEDVAAYSDAVTLKNVMKIAVGDTESDVQKALNSHGDKQGDARLYSGPPVTVDGQGVLVRVAYQSGAVTEITYLDTDACTLPGTVAFPGEGGLDGSVESVEAAVGRAASMVRRYQQDGDDITEIHFGYLDPFFNFNPAWRGECVVVQNHTQETAELEYWTATDSADPLVIDTLEGKPIANQYDNYTDFLNDKYSTEKTFYMLNKYSTGDVERVFGSFEQYNTDAGVVLNALESQETLADGSPVYRMSFGFDSRGRFVLCSYTNLRLLHKEDMLVDSKYAEVTRGMSYNEVRDLMGVLPTAVIIDQNYFTLCYGKQMGGATFEQQFEFIVRFDINNNYVQNLWDNMTSGW